MLKIGKNYKVFDKKHSIRAKFVFEAYICKHGFCFKSDILFLLIA